MPYSHFIVGLGNPGARYEHTRHNVGFMLLDALVDQAGRSPSNSVSWSVRVADGSWQEKMGALVMGVSLGDFDILLVKPQSYMNLSGRPVQALQHFYKLPVDRVIVVHDEVDLPFGVLRLKQGGGDGGHNGIRSIAAEIGSSDFFRLRVGIGRPTVPGIDTGRLDLESWVLGKFSPEESKSVAGVLEQGTKALEDLCQLGLTAAQNRHHQDRGGQ